MDNKHHHHRHHQIPIWSSSSPPKCRFCKDSLLRFNNYNRTNRISNPSSSSMHPRPEEQLKQRGYCVYYLSNIPEDVLDLLMHRDFEGLFDGGVAS